jgi:3-oxoacyl-[acyl-carrier protein] reductase
MASGGGDGPRFDGQVGIVTGAASGIGAATVGYLTRSGATVVAVDRDADGLEALWSNNSRVQTMTVDVSDSNAVTRVVNDAVSALGRLDFLAHAAGVDASRAIKVRVSEYYDQRARGNGELGLSATADLSDDEWRRVVGVNLDGTFYCVRAALTHMIPARKGNIVTVSSVGGIVGAAGYAHYSASKGGVRTFTQAVAREVEGFGIRVNCIAPGAIDTPMLARTPRAVEDGKSPNKRVGHPDEVAAAIAFLLSDLGSFIVGETLNVSAGMLIV